MVFRDLREWIRFLEEEGELLRIQEEVRLEPDVGAIGKAICESEGPGAFLEKIAGYTTPLTIGLHASWRRAALALGLKKNAPREEQLTAWSEGWKRFPVPPVEVRDGPCKENVIVGEEVNLFSFPIPRVNQQDGSFYICKPCCITRDPDTGVVNVGMYRMMALDRNKTTILIPPHQDAGRSYAKYRQRGQTMETAVALGTEPVLPMVAGTRIPSEWSEYDFAGALRGKPEELVRGETVDLPVPAGAEIVLEGEIGPDSALEGPFGEYHGAYSGYLRLPVFHIRAITHRTPPIFDTLYIGRPNTENHYMTLFGKLVGAEAQMKNLIPSITRMAYLGPYGMNAVIQGRWRHSGEPRQAMNAWWGSSFGPHGKLLICVDEDVDPWNPFDVMWAIATRVQGDRDIVLMPHSQGVLDPTSNREGLSCKIGIDATKPRYPAYPYEPVDWVSEPPETARWKERILRHWKGVERL